jgi:hypothetical protein
MVNAQKEVPSTSLVSKVDGLLTGTEVVHFKKAPHVLLSGFVILVELDRLPVILFCFVIILKYLRRTFLS